MFGIRRQELLSLPALQVLLFLLPPLRELLLTLQGMKEQLGWRGGQPWACTGVLPLSGQSSFSHFLASLPSHFPTFPDALCVSPESSASVRVV